MAFDGYLSFGGIELINAARTAAYVHNLMPSFALVRRTDLYNTLPEALEHAPYRSPFLDGADWVETRQYSDPGTLNPSHGFYGLYPLSIEGIGDSTMSAEVIEGILDGGAVNSERDATRSIRVRGLLIGADQLAVEAGLTWLRNALRTNSCAMHGDLCGYTDLRYFLAKPDVCWPRWRGPEFSYGSIVPMGAIDVATSPLVYSAGDAWQNETYPGQPFFYQWVFPDVGIDGVKIRWGLLEEAGPGVLEEHGPLYLQRSNFIVNPSFEVNTGGWQVADGSVTRRASGDDHYARFDQDDPVQYRTNWLPDPSFENGDPNGNGWRGNVSDVVDGTAPQGAHVAVVPANVGGNWLEASMLGPYDLGVTGTLSFWTFGAADVEVLVTDNSGVQIFSETLTGLSAGWQRVSVSDIPMMRDYVLRLATDGAQELRLDGILLERVATLEDYFDGDFPDDPGTETSYYFVDGVPAGASRKSVGLFSTFVAETSPTDAPFGPAVLTFDMRSANAQPTVLVELVDTEDAVIGSVIVTPGANWTRYALGVPYGRRVRPRFTSSTGQFDLDHAMLEPTTEVNVYFDGDTPAPEDYTVGWAGTRHSSISRMTWTEQATTDAPHGGRPFLALDQGSLSSVEIAASTQFMFPMSEQLEPYDRTYHRVSTTTGVKRIADLNLDVGAATEVDFVLTAANPHAYSTQWTSTSPPSESPVSFDDDDFPLPPPPEPIVDPTLPPLPTPPSPPVIPDEAIDPITEWSRYYIEIPRGNVALWAGTVPTLEFSTVSSEVRLVRVRFHPNPFEWDVEQVDPTSYCGEFILSYMPANSVLTISGTTEGAWAQVAGAAPQSANHLLYGTGGTPMEWPELTCGLPYVVTVDVPPDTVLDDFIFNMRINRRE